MPEASGGVEHQSEVPSFSVLRHQDVVIRVSVPDGLKSSLNDFFPFEVDAGERLGAHIVVADGDGGYSLSLDGDLLFENVPAGDVVAAINQAIQLVLINDDSAGYLSAGLLAYSGRGILVLGSDIDLRNDVVAWMLGAGFSYRSQSLVQLAGKARCANGFSLPLSISANALVHGDNCAGLRYQPSVLGSNAVNVAPPVGASEAAVELVVFVSRSASGRVSIKTPSVEGVLGVTQELASSQALAALEALLAVSPLLAVGVGNTEDLRGVLDMAIRMFMDNGFSSEDVGRFCAAFSEADNPLRVKHPIQPRSERRLEAKLTIGMATYDDFDGAYFSIQAMRLYHPEILDDVEFLVIDNNPSGVEAKYLKDIENIVPNYRYIPSDGRTGTAVRDLVFQEAAGDFVLCMDSHVLFEAGAIKALLAYFDEHPDSLDLIQGPIIWENLASDSSHWEERWDRGMFGVWNGLPTDDKTSGPPFEIPMQGLGVFACRRAAWPGFNPAFKGFGGEEGYIHNKFRQRGGRALCLPALRWMHRFARPRGVPYTINWHDRFRNYLLGRRELGLAYDDVIAHMNDYLGQQYAEKLLLAYERSGEIELRKLRPG
ncbi:glycosyltransferase [Devosia epidermidihirudinis]|uniref:glycosyltransferase n=1 Tax=Devosia epidermidihirudinis TaxID=1293439 RepID=UPI000A6A442C|nr:glycosyltransferase [Devosia epidermidihirudinis]